VGLVPGVVGCLADGKRMEESGALVEAPWRYEVKDGASHRIPLHNDQSAGLGRGQSVEVHRAGEMVVDLGRQLVADTVTRTAEVRIRPGTSQDVPGEGVGGGTEC